MNFSDKNPLLNFNANFVVQWVSDLGVGAVVLINKCGCLEFQQFEEGDTDTEAV